MVNIVNDATIRTWDEVVSAYFKKDVIIEIIEGTFLNLKRVILYGYSDSKDVESYTTCCHIKENTGKAVETRLAIKGDLTSWGDSIC